MVPRLLLAVLLTLCTLPAAAQTAAPDLRAQVEAILAQAPKGSRFGLLVTDEQGREVIAIAPDQRFIPASNTKLFTTAAALALLPSANRPFLDGGTEVYLAPAKSGAGPHVLLVGHGNPALSSAPDCKVQCLATLADAVAARTKTVGDVIGDDAIFTDQRWSPGMSWNNLGDSDATAASALTLDDNALPVEVKWDRTRAKVEVTAPAYVNIFAPSFVGEASPFDSPAFHLEHELNSRNFRLYATTKGNPDWSNADPPQPWRAMIGIDDPAHYAAWTLAEMLRQRGVSVTGKVWALHRPVEIDMLDEGSFRVSAGAPLAKLGPPALIEDVTVTNKTSQNLHAELLLRRMAIGGSWNTLEEALQAEQALFDKAGIPRDSYELYDGSGMSTYNRVTPRAVVALLRWTRGQVWGAGWRASLPVGGVDGTLRRRFAGTALQGRIQAKTGSLLAANALSGYFTAASGRELTFSFFANDVPSAGKATTTMDAVIQAIAAAN